LFLFLINYWTTTKEAKEAAGFKYPSMQNMEAQFTFVPSVHFFLSSWLCAFLFFFLGILQGTYISFSMCTLLVYCAAMAASSLISSNEADVELGRKQAKQHSGPSARRILSLASQESRYITVGIVTLLVRLPLSLAMPHYMSATVGRAIASTSQDGPFLPAGVWDNFKRFLLSACGNAALGTCTIALARFRCKRAIAFETHFVHGGGRLGELVRPSPLTRTGVRRG